MKLFRQIAVLILVCLVTTIGAQNRGFVGKRMVKNYLPSEYSGGSQNWAIVADSNRQLFIGNQFGVLHLNGGKWSRVATRNGSAVRALATDENGKIYYGAIREFGALKISQKGIYNLEVLSDAVEFHSPDVWSVHAYGSNKICFHTEAKLFIRNSDSIEFITPEGNFFYLTYKINNNLIVLDVGVGLKLLTDTTYLFIEGSQRFKNDRIESILVDSENKLTFILRNGKIYRADIVFLPNPALINFREVALKINSPQNLGVYCAYQVSDTLIAIGTTQKGLFLIDTCGTIHLNLNMNNQLLSDAIHSIHYTHDGVLWLAQDMVISCVELASDIQYWDYSLGIKGAVSQFYFYKNKLYAATSYGLFVLEKSSSDGQIHAFRQVSGIKNQTWGIEILATKTDTLLLTIASDGLYKIDSVARKIANIDGAFSLAVINSPKPLILVGHFKGISLLEYIDKQFVTLPKRVDLQGQVRKIAIDQHGDIWLSVTFGGVYRVLAADVVSQRSVIPVQKFVPHDLQDFRLANPSHIENSIVFVINGNLYKPDLQSGDLKRYDSLNSVFQKYNIVLGNMQWVAKDRSLWVNGQFRISFDDRKNIFVDSIPIGRLDISMIYQSMIVGNRLFLSSEKGVFQIDLNHFIPKDQLAKPLIKAIVTTTDTIPVYDSRPAETFVYPLPKITIQFAPTHFLASDKMKFRTRLVGFERDFINIENQTEKTYTNLLPGEYRFEVVSVDMFGRESEPTFIEFQIDAPWYLTIYAFIAYALLLVWIMINITRQRTRRLQRIRKYLELQVEQRTTQIAQQNVELKKLSIIVEKTDNAVSVFSPEGLILWCNSAFTQIYGYTVEEFIRSKGETIFLTHEAAQVREAYQRCLQQKQTVRYEFFTLNRYDQGIWIQTTLTPLLNENQEITALIAVDTDVTNLKNADEEIRYQKEQLEVINTELKELSAIAEETDNAVVVADKEGKILWVNRGFTTIYGFTLEELVATQTNILDLTSNHELESWINNWPSDKKSIQYHSQNNTKDGRQIWAYTTITPVRNSLGQIIRFIGIDSDITKLKLAEEEIERQKLELEKINATKDKFLGIIGHDLRSPFGNFVGITNLLLQNFNDFSSEELHQYIVKLNRSAQNSYNLLENLVAWARSQREMVQVSPQRANIISVIKENLELLAPFSERKKVEIIEEFPDFVEAVFDEDTIRTVIRNLLFNALKYSYPGGKIVVQVQRLATAVRVNIIDNGVGISEDDLKNLFRIDTVHATLGTENERGTGLGLVLCVDFIQRNHGDIGAESKLGAGSTFWFTLPS
ncbi:MAG TPA: PAS domain-containing sensor histidine kinase [Salinivirgaceae bacterium]|nr:PAS domain-containing sensor histidine kinase [Salinivirgaceae bacterium]